MSLTLGKRNFACYFWSMYINKSILYAQSLTNISNIIIQLNHKDNNALTGPIPTELGGLTVLEVLNLGKLI